MMPGAAVIGRPSAGGSQVGQVVDLGVLRGQLVVYVQWEVSRLAPGTVLDKRWLDCVPRSHVTARVS